MLCAMRYRGTRMGICSIDFGELGLHPSALLPGMSKEWNPVYQPRHCQGPERPEPTPAAQRWVASECALRGNQAACFRWTVQKASVP